MRESFAAQEFETLATANFDPTIYSELKFGSNDAALLLGSEMADAFYLKHGDILKTQQCVVIPSAYNVVEIAAVILARAFADRLNHLLVMAGHDIVQYTTMHRTVSYLNDYADVPVEQRLALLSQDELYIKEDFIADKTLLFVDDIQITGTHERKIVEFLDKRGLKNPTIFAYYARYTGDRAQIEGELNRTGIKSLTDFITLHNNTPTTIMVRTLRLWLQASDSERAWAASQVSNRYLWQVYNAVLARGYYSVPEMKPAFEHLRSLVFGEVTYLHERVA